MKSKNIILIGLLTVMLTLSLFSVNVSAATTKELGIVSVREGGYGYRLNTKIVWKIVEYNNNKYSFDNAFYCIKAGKGFGDNVHTSNVIYTKSGDMKNLSTIPTIVKEQVLPTNDSNYNAILWILDNMYLPKDENAQMLKTNLLTKANILNQNSQLFLSDDDIEVVQQWAIWHFANSDSATYSGTSLPEPQLSQDGNNFNLTFDNIEGKNGLTRSMQASQLYNYLITNAARNASAYGTGNNRNITKVPAVLDDTVVLANVENGKITVGPFKITETNKDYELVTSFTDQDGKPLSYTLLTENKIPVAQGVTIKDLANNNFYLQIPEDANITKLKFKAEVKYIETETALWLVVGRELLEQPVVEVKKKVTSVPKEVEINIAKKEFDLALRKFITGLNGNNITNRVPTVNLSGLATGTTAIYEHTKDPVTVEIGDIVKYRIRVYNEGQVNGYVEEITDYIPEGLGFITGHSINVQNGWIVPSNQTVKTVKLSTIPNALEHLQLSDFVDVTNLYDVDIVTGKVTTDKLKYNANDTTKSNLLKAYAQGNTELSYKDVEIACVVLDNKNLKNIAEISKHVDENGNTNIVDRDSTPNNVDINTYPSNRNVEDDDDFERLIVKQSFDLALRKFITKINGVQVPIDRTPVLDKANLGLLYTNAITTADKKHIKTPLKVKNGDVVTYTIRVYNEGDIDGYATEVTDYLPTGLRFKEDSEINRQYGWTNPSGDGRTLVTNYLADKLIKTNIDPSEYTGPVEIEDDITRLFFAEDVEIECIVAGTVNNQSLKNVAEITDDSDANGNAVEDRDSTPDNLTDTQKNSYNPGSSEKGWGYEDDDDYEELILEIEDVKIFDLALRKFITSINGNAVESREPLVDLSTLKTGTTARYEHSKIPLSVEVGDIVRYTLRIYNEGEISGFAEEISDYIPEGLGFIIGHNVNADNKWLVTQDQSLTTVKLNTIPNVTKNIKLTDFSGITDLNTVEVVKGNAKITTDKLKYDNTKSNLLVAYDEASNQLAYKDVEVVCVVLGGEDQNVNLKNIAEISKCLDENGNNITDRDSTPNNVNISTYPDSTNVEDDDDFEKLVLKEVKKEFDLALRKFITAVGDKEINTRIPIPKIDATTGKITYEHPKDVVILSNGDLVTYTIRVYNEGEVSGYAKLVSDILPDGLEFVPDNPINKQYRWQATSGNKMITTDYLSKEQSDNNLIQAFDIATMKSPAYKDLKIVCKVNLPDDSNTILINTAEIEDDSDENGNDVVDRDSTPANRKDGEDDIDIEKVRIVIFDLSLRKFITQVDNEKIRDREPVVNIDQSGKITYEHPKNPVSVANSNIVIYTIRVYNEGNTDGYAEEITDDVPKGLVFLPDHEVNIEYGWKESTSGVITTDYLSSKNSTSNLLKAFNKSQMMTPDYKDVKVAFRVTEENLPGDRVIINTAEISKDSNEYDVKDKDSTPGNNTEGEDDIDKEYLKVKYFDLSLLKYITQVHITEDGKERVVETGHTGLENPEPLVKVEIDKKKLKTTIVNFVYTIKITNEGEIAGYAKEIIDRVPEGLRFVAEDNPKWSIKEDGSIITDQLADTLLNPGESATVTIVLRWINGENNLNEKVNVAEINKDYNEFGARDIDSIPGNNVEGEDDIDDAPVILSIKTGMAKYYIGVFAGCVMILSAGTLFIRRYVI